MNCQCSSVNEIYYVMRSSVNENTMSDLWFRLKWTSHYSTNYICPLVFDDFDLQQKLWLVSKSNARPRAGIRSARPSCFSTLRLVTMRKHQVWETGSSTKPVGTQKTTHRLKTWMIANQEARWGINRSLHRWDKTILLAFGTRSKANRSGFRCEDQRRNNVPDWSGESANELYSVYLPKSFDCYK